MPERIKVSLSLLKNGSLKIFLLVVSALVLQSCYSSTAVKGTPVKDLVLEEEDSPAKQAKTQASKEEIGKMSSVKENTVFVEIEGVPEGFPLPIYQGTKIVVSDVKRGDDGSPNEFTITGESQHPDIKGVGQYYREALEKAGFVINNDQTQDMGELLASRSPESAAKMKGKLSVKLEASSPTSEASVVLMESSLEHASSLHLGL